MDPICKLLLCPPALYLRCHWLFSKIEIPQPLKNNKRFGKIGTLPGHFIGPRRDPQRLCGILVMTGLIIIRDFVFPSTYQFISTDINKMKSISVTLEK